MSFLWPEMLWLLLIVPAAVAAYFQLLRRKKKLALRYASLNIVKEAMGAGQRIRRHIPPLLFLLALTLMMIAIARPTSVVRLPSQYGTIILAIDASVSMRANDVAPTRIAAAQSAARNFVEDLPHNTRVGVVSFAATASVVQPPTLNREDIVSAIDRLQLQRGTAIGSGILVALKMIFPEIDFDLSSSDPHPGNSRDASRGASLDNATKAPTPDLKPVPPGSYNSAAIILLTDGQATTGPEPVEAARMAAERGIRVFTVGIGTANGEIMGAEGWSMRVRLDEESLKQIASVTKAEYFYTDNAADLKKIYNTLNSRLFLEKKETEITVLFTAVAALFAFLSGLLSLLWFNRML
jgi:Ca-activated chloride channel family protein